MSKYKRKRKKKKFDLFYVFIIAMILSSILFSLDKSKNKSLFGYRYYSILSNSMAPTYNKGDLIFVKITPCDEIEIGDVISYVAGTDSTVTITHRVAEILLNYFSDGTPGFVTKGDNNKSKDMTPVNSANIVGVVVGKVPVVGDVAFKIKTNAFAVICSLVIFILLYYNVQLIILVSRKNKHRAR